MRPFEEVGNRSGLDQTTIRQEDHVVGHTTQKIQVVGSEHHRLSGSISLLPPEGSGKSLLTRSIENVDGFVQQQQIPVPIQSFEEIRATAEETRAFEPAGDGPRNGWLEHQVRPFGGALQSTPKPQIGHGAFCQQVKNRGFAAAAWTHEHRNPRTRQYKIQTVQNLRLPITGKKPLSTDSTSHRIGRQITERHSPEAAVL